MEYKPEFVYTGLKYGYFGEGVITKHKDEFLFQIWKELNEEVFNDELPVPTFLAFAKTYFRKSKTRDAGYFHRAKYDNRYGICISIERYFMNGIEAVRRILLHEMVHTYCWIKGLEHNDNTVDFIYHCGWFKAELSHNGGKPISQECINFVKMYDIDVL